MDLFQLHAVGVAFLNARTAFADPAGAAQWWRTVHDQAGKALPLQAPSKPRFDLKLTEELLHTRQYGVIRR